MKLERIFLSEAAQTQNSKYPVFSHLWGLTVNLQIFVSCLEYPLRSENQQGAMGQNFRGGKIDQSGIKSLQEIMVQ